ncbi:MAG: hypothetical protein WC976_07240 [Caldisericia bacterium]
MKNIFSFFIIKDSGRAWEQCEIVHLCKRHDILAVMDARFLRDKNVDERFFNIISNEWIDIQEREESASRKKSKSGNEKIVYAARNAMPLPQAKKFVDKLLLVNRAVAVLVKEKNEMEDWNRYAEDLVKRFPYTKVKELTI